jgi:hypothetical protein
MPIWLFVNILKLFTGLYFICDQLPVMLIFLSPLLILCLLIQDDILTNGSTNELEPNSDFIFVA